jgi:hypothetical protein
VLKGAAEFLLDYLVEDRDGKLVIVPSTSPENSYIHPETGQPVRITRGSTYHTSIVRAVFESVTEGSRTRILGRPGAGVSTSCRAPRGLSAYGNTLRNRGRYNHEVGRSFSPHSAPLRPFRPARMHGQWRVQRDFGSSAIEYHCRAASPRQAPLSARPEA